MSSSPLKKPSPEANVNLSSIGIEKVFEFSNELVFLIEPQTAKIQFANPKAIRSTLFDQEELLKMNFSDLLLKKEHKKFKALIKTTLHWNSGEEAECLYKNHKGQIKYISIKSSLIEKDKNKCILLQVIEKNNFLGSIDESEQEAFPVARSRYNQLLQYFKSGKDSVTKDTVLKSLGWLAKITTEQLFEKLEHHAVNEAVSRQKEVIVERIGEKIKIDQRLIEPLFQAFSYIIENAFEHAFYDIEKCKFIFKAEIQDDKSLLFEIQDDGHGIATHTVKQIAEENKLATSKELNRMKDFEVQQLVFNPGFSTKDSSESEKNQNIGLDSVKDFIERNFAGDIKLYSTFGEGTRVNITIPANAFLISKSTHFCFPKQDGEQWDIDELEKRLNFKLEQVRSGRKIPHASGLIIDFKDLERAKKSRAPLDQSIVVHELDNEKLVTEILVDDSINHAISKDIPNYDLILRTCLGKQAGAPIWGLESYLWPGSDIFEADMKNYESKQKILSKIRDFAKELNSFNELENVLYKLSDELVMNGMFDAPVDEEGNPKYNHLDRSTKLQLESEEKVTFRFGADPNWVAVSIVDRFGALDPDIIRKYVHRCVTSENQQNDSSGGAGLGLFTIFNNCHYLVVNIDPGVATEFICLIKLTRSYGKFKAVGKSFSFYKGESKYK